MKPDDGYELRDFGNGRKLERFGEVVIDRPCPAAEGVRAANPAIWRSVVARFEGTRAGDGKWSPAAAKWVPAEWWFTHDVAGSRFRLRLDALPSGQIGVFPEQRENWEWIAKQVASASTRSHELASSNDKVVEQTGDAPSPRLSPGGRGSGNARRVLNLFAYTGGSTLAAAVAGAEVVHVDAARSMVERARANALASGLADRPVHWIVEDAVKFCQREVKRGNQYDAVILDPPTYGHGPKGEPWKVGEHLLPLLQLCGELTSQRRAFVLMTCHSPGIGPAELGAYLADGVFGHCGQPPATGELFLATADGRRLPSGVFARWPR